ncbi:MAG: protein phosphatase 2C domain-containing protein [Polyangiaceae bacterium]|nr:protein phosphatase 2C domain-containing protein [Polyangiaceae bacterium]
MPTAVVLIALIAAGLALVGLVLVLCRRAAAPEPSKAQQDPSRRGMPAAATAVKKSSRANEQSAEHNLPSFTSESSTGDSDPEITMMGRVPDEILQIMRGSAEAPKGEVVNRLPDQDLSADLQMDVEVEVEELVECDHDEDTTGAQPLILVVGVARSDRGRRRMCNEDAFLIMEDEHLFVVADGMGGHNAGDVASQKAIDAIEACFRTHDFPGEPNPGWPRRADETVRSVRHANAQVHALANSEEQLRGMGTTVVAVRFSPNKQRAYIAHVGDSRCYRIRNGVLHQLTEDHTLGRLMGTKGKAARHLAQAVGVSSEVAVDLAIDEPQPGDHYLVCSDGLTKMVPDDVILPLALESNDLEQKAKRLIQEANDRGGRDNITVIIIRIERPTTK